MNLPFGGLTVSNGSGTLALTTSFAKFAGWGAISADDGMTSQGDSSVKPDLTNNRMLCGSPGTYKVSVDFNVSIDGTQDLTFQVYVNGVARMDLRSQLHAITTSTQPNVTSFSGYLKITGADNPKTVKPFGDAAATSNPPDQGGWSGAPKTMVPVEIYIKSGSSTPTITIIDAHFNIERML